jgi:hypothetical protein
MLGLVNFLILAIAARQGFAGMSKNWELPALLTDMESV